MASPILRYFDSSVGCVIRSTKLIVCMSIVSGGRYYLGSDCCHSLLLPCLQVAKKKFCQCIWINSLIFYLLGFFFLQMYPLWIVISFFVLFCFYFNFIFLTLQYCIGFAIYQHESATGIHVFPILNPPPSPYHPSGLSQCTSPKHPVSCIEPGLETHFIYDIIHVSVPFFQIIPSSPSPTESKRLFYMIQWMLAIWSLVPLPFLNLAWTSGSSWFTYCLSLA